MNEPQFRVLYDAVNLTIWGNDKWSALCNQLNLLDALTINQHGQATLTNAQRYQLVNLLLDTYHGQYQSLIEGLRGQLMATNCSKAQLQWWITQVNDKLYHRSSLTDLPF